MFGNEKAGPLVPGLLEFLNGFWVIVILFYSTVSRGFVGSEK